MVFDCDNDRLEGSAWTFDYGSAGPSVHFEILGRGDKAVVLQVDEDGLPYTPPPRRDDPISGAGVAAAPPTDSGADGLAAAR
jgi:hypothetical protein